MNKSTVTGIIIGMVIASAGAVIANYTVKKDGEPTPAVAVVEEGPLDQVSESADLAEGSMPDEHAGLDDAIAHEESQLAAAEPATSVPRSSVSSGYSAPAAQPTYAEVLSVTPLTETQSTPREVCQQVEVTEKAPVKDENQVTGTVAGAIIGGVLGNQVGGGKGKKLATVAGAVAGGFAGKKVQESMQNGNTSTHMETRCDTVYDSNDVVKGYDVAYRLNGREGTVRMDYDPGTRIPVENGHLVIR